LPYATSGIRRHPRDLLGQRGASDGFRRNPQVRDETNFQDLRQELLADILARLPKFDGKRASAKTFVSRLIDNRIANLIKHRRARCRDPGREESSLDDWVRDEDGKWTRRAETITEDEALASAGRLGRSRQEQVELALDTAVVINGLPADLKDLCVRLRTQTVARISRETGVPRARLYERIAALRARFREAGMDRYL